MKKLLLVINPCSGQRKARKHLLEVTEIFNRAGYTVITHITAGPGDGETAVLQYASDVERIVCCGGDGTFNEVVSGLLKSGLDRPIGYIPAGSTNDFAASLRLNGNLCTAAKDIVEGTTKKLDVGLFGTRYFSYIASFGAFTRSSYATPQSLKNLLGHTAYVLSGIQELSQIKSYPLRLELEDGTVIEDQFLFGAVSNSTSVGGILTLDSDQVDMTDGSLELLLVRRPKSLAELSDCVWALQQKTYNCNIITFLKTAKVTITAPNDMPWTLDGEQEPGHDQVTIQCLHHAIEVFHNDTASIEAAQ